MDALRERRVPDERKDVRGNNNSYYWTPNTTPFHVVHHIENSNKKNKKRKKNYDPYFIAKMEAWKKGTNTLIYQELISEQTPLCTSDVIAQHFIDEKGNYWLMALNPNILDNRELNNRLKYNFEINKKNKHSKEELLKAVCGSECFLFFSNKLWDLNLEQEDKIHKLLEVFIFTMSFINLGDFLNDPIFRISLGFEDAEVNRELDNLSIDAWYNTLTNKNLYFDLFNKNDDELQQIKTNFNINYTKNVLEYLCIFHNDNCIYRETESKEYLTTLICKKVVHQKELEGADIINRIQTKEFTCMTMKLNKEQKNYHSVVGNEHDHAYIIYNGQTPIIRTTQILDEAIVIWKKFTKKTFKEKLKSKNRKIFSKIMNFKIPGYFTEEIDTEIGMEI